MPWFRLDDSFHSHPKVIAAGNEAVGLYVRCGTYCAEHLTDGFIPEHVALLYGSSKLAETLVRTKLWRRVRGGWRMPDYLEYNPSGQQVDQERKAKTERQRRWRETKKRSGGDTSETQETVGQFNGLTPVEKSENVYTGTTGQGTAAGQPRVGRHRVDASTQASRDASVDAPPSPAPPRPEGSGAGGARPGTKRAANGRAGPSGPAVRVARLEDRTVADAIAEAIPREP